MAEKVSTSSIGLQSLQEQLTCHVCLGQFRSPKTLPCLHSFCLQCIEQLPLNLEKGRDVISCPTYHKTIQLPLNGPHNFPTSFLIQSLQETQQILSKVSEDKQISCDNCEQSDVTRYCKQCGNGFCEKCLGIHNGLKVNAKHDIIDVKDVISTTQQEVTI